MARDYTILGDIIALSSPSGRMSGRAHRAALARIDAKRAAEYEPPAPLTAAELADRERAACLRQAAELRDLAARGMSPRKYARRAAELEKRAAALAASSAGGCPQGE